MGRAFVQYINGAVDSAQKLPAGIYDGVDALRKAKEEAEKFEQVIGIALSEAFADAQSNMNRFLNAFLAFKVASTGNPFDFMSNYEYYVGLGNTIVDGITSAATEEEKLADQAKRYEKVQERLAKVAEKRAKEAQKAALAARNERLELEGIKNIQRNEIEAMLAPKANTGINFEAEALLREAYDASELADFNAEMLRLGQIA